MTDPKKELRPVISSIEQSAHSSIEETFQNEVLRPIIKLQHELIVSCFVHFLRLNKIKLDEFSPAQKTQVVQKLFKSDMRLKVELRGLIIGLFTLNEYKVYLNHSAQLNKRIYNMIQQRVESL